MISAEDWPPYHRILLLPLRLRPAAVALMLMMMRMFLWLLSVLTVRPLLLSRGSRRRAARLRRSLCAVLGEGRYRCHADEDYETCADESGDRNSRRSHSTSP